MSNVMLARRILGALAEAGVVEVVLCAGARNAPLVASLSAARGVRTYSFFDERAAAFFALGRAVVTDVPVAVITTSGTAVAECLPAVIEADLQRRPLVIVSADRPRRYRGTGAPQTITQPGLFSSYASPTLDVEGAFDPAAVAAWGRDRPLHLNVCFDEPLLDQAIEGWDWPAARTSTSTAPSPGPGPAVEFAARHPLVLVGPLSRADARVVRPHLVRWGRPLWLEATSQLRGDPALATLEITGGRVDAAAFDGVIRVGGVPTLRLWRDLEKFGGPIAHFSRGPWPGLPGEHVVHSLDRLGALGGFEVDHDAGPDRARAARLERLLSDHPRSECAWVRRVSEWIAPDAHLWLGSSLPIREWDLAAARATRPRVFANRGANGIDGLVSAFAAVAEPGRANWALLGDLTTLYDLSGPWALRERPVDDFTLVIINNGGGKIFTRIFGDPRFENRHDLDFEAWAAQWRLSYQAFREPGEVPQVRGPRVLEIRPDADETAAFWTAWETPT